MYTKKVSKTHNLKGLSPVVIVLLIVVIGGYLIYSGKINLNTSLNQNSTGQAKSTPAYRIPPDAGTMGKPNSSDETANWKTYVSNKGKYSLKYPNDWQIKSDNEILGSDTTKTTLQSNDLITKTINTPGIGGEQLPKGSKLEVVLSLNPNFKSYEQLKDFMDNKSTMFPLNYFTSNEEIIVDGVKSTIRRGGKPTTLALGNTFGYCFNNGITYEFTFNNSENDDTLFNQILSTFKFTN